MALLIIMGYHFGVGGLQGGFFSLDIFYVLSGFLITGLLLGEYQRRGRIILSAFWLRRARRLLPALLVMLVVVTICVRFVAQPGTYPDFRMSALSALFYFSNWWQIAASGNYFVVTGPVSPLTHTWSLAVEEQFYLIWPLVVLAVLHVTKTFAKGLRALLVLSVVGATASATEMALLYSPTANTTRLYFGTDTHAQSILIGAAMACAMLMIQRRQGTTGLAPQATSPTARRLLVLVGLVGFAVMFTLANVATGTAAFDYQGGFAISALASAAVIIGAVCVPSGVVARVLSLRPLVWLGTISYGAYLWHFPIYIFVDSTNTGLYGLWLMAFRFASTIVIAAASFYLVERPVMYGTFWRSLKAIVPSVALLGATVAVVVAGTVVVATAAPGVNRFHGHGSAQTPFANSPKTVVVLGDSTAYTLGFALAATAPNGTTVANGGLFGCGLAIASYSSNNPPVPQEIMFPACRESTPASQQWPAFDTARIRSTRPGPGDVVLFVAGDWEVQDLLMNGHWTNILEPSFQRYEMTQMRKAVKIGTTYGAHFDFLTMPAEDNALQSGGAAAPEDSPEGVAIYNGLLRTVAAEYPGKVSVVDYGKILSPKGVFTEYLDGIQIRTPDGIHTPSYAPGNPFANNSTQAVAQAFYNWISPRIWPLIERSVPTTISQVTQ